MRRSSAFCIRCCCHPARERVAGNGRAAVAVRDTFCPPTGARPRDADSIRLTAVAIPQPVPGGTPPPARPHDPPSTTARRRRPHRRVRRPHRRSRANIHLHGEQGVCSGRNLVTYTVTVKSRRRGAPGHGRQLFPRTSRWSGRATRLPSRRRRARQPPAATTRWSGSTSARCPQGRRDVVLTARTWVGAAGGPRTQVRPHVVLRGESCPAGLDVWAWRRRATTHRGDRLTVTKNVYVRRLHSATVGWHCRRRVRGQPGLWRLTVGNTAPRHHDAVSDADLTRRPSTASRGVRRDLTIGTLDAARSSIRRDVVPASGTSTGAIRRAATAARSASSPTSYASRVRR